jgi:benzoyl-CoA reductase/2-hydroxyglutaryl-CoA dehydratase subunit BcrC/BadD/HgdB
VNRLYDIQASGNVLKWRDVFETVHAGFYLDRTLYLALLKELIAEAESQARTESLDAPEQDIRKPRIFVSGSIIPPGDVKIIDLIEETGGRIVGDDLCSGLRPFRGLSVTEPTVTALADAYLSRVPCAALPKLRLEGDMRVENLTNSVRDTSADGLVYHTLRYCDPFTFKAAETKRLFAPDVPFLEVHTEYATSDVEGIRTRLRAFMEVLNGQIARKRKEAV